MRSAEYLFFEWLDLIVSNIAMNMEIRKDLQTVSLRLLAGRSRSSQDSRSETATELGVPPDALRSTLPDIEVWRSMIRLYSGIFCTLLFSNFTCM